MQEYMLWEIVPLFVMSAGLIWLLVRALLRYRGWWSSEMRGGSFPPKGKQGGRD